MDDLSHLLPIRAPLSRWAFVEDGFVTRVASSTDESGVQPFGDLPEGARAINVRGVPCEPGYLVDAKGNVAPAEGRTEPLLPHEAAYHAVPAAPPVHTAVLAARVAGGEPHPLETADAPPAAV